MKPASLLALLSLTVAAAASGAEPAPGIPPGRDFGAALTLREVSPLAEVAAHPERYGKESVLVRGVVREVCQRKGCWMVLTDGEAHLRVRFRDYGFFVPKDCSGQEAYAEGIVEVEEISEEEARHYASESRQGDPSKIHGPQRVVQFTASGVRLLPAP